MFLDFSSNQIEEVMLKAWQAFRAYRKLSLEQRADFLRSIAGEIENSGDELIKVAMR